MSEATALPPAPQPRPIPQIFLHVNVFVSAEEALHRRQPGEGVDGDEVRDGGEGDHHSEEGEGRR